MALSWLKINRAKRARSLMRELAQNRSVMSEYEKHDLIPDILERLSSFHTWASEIVKTSSDVKTMEIYKLGYAAHVLRINQSTAPVTELHKEAEQWLSAVGQTVERDLIKPIDEAMKLGNELIPPMAAKSRSGDYARLMKFLNKSRMVARTIAHSNGSFLFWRHFEGSVVSVQDGSPLTKTTVEFKEHLLATMYMATTIDQMISAASALDGTIDRWSQSRDNERQKFNDYLVATTEDRATQRTLWINSTSIVLGVVISFAFFRQDKLYDAESEARRARLECQDVGGQQQGREPYGRDRATEVGPTNVCR